MVNLRAAESRHLPAVLTLLERLELPTAGVAEGFAEYLVAETDGEVVGVVGLELYGSSALLRSAAVDDRWRSTGLGRRLVEQALELARRHGIEDIYLLTTTAERYFPRFGFARVSRDEVASGVRASVEFQTACPASATVMRKTLA